ncbi:MAG: YqeG family HAD IIIA-type phosphatase [Muribaculaceae bacterium]|nr:YqeG family HAD IIIA-type phosphatase [Muribaculaceae bacterium]
MFLKPDYNLKRIFDIDLSELKNDGIKAMLFDLDSTLMASKSGCYTPEILDWLGCVRKDFFIAVVSNNKNPEYISKVESVSDFPTLFCAAKPKTARVQKFLTEHGLNPQDCVLVGDRPLTDILCGKNLGCKTILVDSITADSEAKIVRFVRALERLTIRK